MKKYTLFNVWYRKDPGSMYDVSRISKEIVASDMGAALTDFKKQYKDLHPVAVEVVFYMGKW
jgi:hypothetical protein